jgi:parvulin-like peptidyl-prolyl isomerase
MKYRTESEFKEMLFSKNLNIETLRNKIANDLLMEKFYQTHFPVTDDIPMSKLKEVYNENVDSFQTMELVRASHILIKGDDDKSYQKILEIKEKIASGNDFYHFDQQYSECPSQCKCGDLGFVKKGTLMKEFEDILFQLDVNQVSQPIKTEFGYHLIMVTEKKAQTTADFEKVKDALKKRVQQIDCELKLIRYLKKLRAKADIEIFEENL